MVPYVDYNFYKDDWKGSLENEAAFQNVAIKATYEIDCITYHNIKEITKDVKYATCAVIDTISKIQSSIAGSFGKKSESVGNLTVTYDEKLREGTDAVSYTHLDVYKRQIMLFTIMLSNTFYM